jgi:hypothetical protein
MVILAHGRRKHAKGRACIPRPLAGGTVEHPLLLADVVAVFHVTYIAFVVDGFALIVAGAVKRW